MNSRKGKSLKGYPFLKPKSWNSGLVMLVSYFAFDGSLGKNWCGYNSRSEVLVDRIIKGMEDYLNLKEYKIYTNKVTGVKRVAFHNVEVADFIKTKILDLFLYVRTAPESHKQAFLKAFFDDEGSVRFRNGQRSIHGYQNSIKTLNLVQKILLDLGIESKLDEQYYEIVISRRNNIISFQNMINFTPGLRVNGGRKNSIWKKDLEKRAILEMAINSYRN